MKYFIFGENGLILRLLATITVNLTLNFVLNEHGDAAKR